MTKSLFIRDYRNSNLYVGDTDIVNKQPFLSPYANTKRWLGKQAAKAPVD
ncbi:MAG: hypothetical protein AAF600_04650 [Bacteroidota bacterium]